jgi:transposase
MESTSVYWILVHQILEERGFEIYLVNAHYLKNVPGRKSDASDCQWIQYLHSVGLLRASLGLVAARVGRLEIRPDDCQGRNSYRLAS